MFFSHLSSWTCIMIPLPKPNIPGQNWMDLWFNVILWRIYSLSNQEGWRQEVIILSSFRIQMDNQELMRLISSFPFQLRISSCHDFSSEFFFQWDLEYPIFLDLLWGRRSECDCGIKGFGWIGDLISHHSSHIYQTRPWGQPTSPLPLHTWKRQILHWSQIWSKMISKQITIEIF